MFHPGLEQDFQFDQFQRNTPRTEGVFFVYNASGEDIPPHSLAEIQGFVKRDGTPGRGPLFKVVKPTVDSAKNICVIENPIATDGIGTGVMGLVPGGLVVAYDDGIPFPGSTLGAKVGSWKASVDQEGLLSYAYDDATQEYYQDTLITIPVEMRDRCFVRPYELCPGEVAVWQGAGYYCSIMRVWPGEEECSGVQYPDSLGCRYFISDPTGICHHFASGPNVASFQYFLLSFHDSDSTCGGLC